MASGQAVDVTSAMASIGRLARLGAIAQEFGYDYASVRQGGGPQGRGLIMTMVPDLDPRAQERAALNSARYPGAADGGALPPLPPGAVALVKARIAFDLASRLTEKQMLAVAVIGFTAVAGAAAYRFSAHATVLVIVAIVWALLMASLPVGIVVNRRYKAKQVVVLEAAGFRPVTDANGRTRYLAPGRRLPGHGGPSGGRAHLPTA
ncbi:hypothetical protein [Streptomyces rimosus]|uniref:hypothetical protein n=1 Tax=Streptomyces rimosus TaxID=1927 RepID=UPI00067CEC0A|nr:hypothetical protein [Streptomyces rimosus]